jgi:hypothetical protein
MVLATIAVFGSMRLLPGDPAEVMAGETASPEVVASIRHQFGLDQPLPIQYVTWAGNVARGNLGDSIRTHLPVMGTIWSRVPATLELTLGAIVLTLLLALPLGTAAAVHRGQRVDWIISVYNGAMLSVPGFWLDSERLLASLGRLYDITSAVLRTHPYTTLNLVPLRLLSLIMREHRLGVDDVESLTILRPRGLEAVPNVHSYGPFADLETASATRTGKRPATARSRQKGQDRARRPGRPDTAQGRNPRPGWSNGRRLGRPSGSLRSGFDGAPAQIRCTSNRDRESANSGSPRPRARVRADTRGDRRVPQTIGSPENG